MVVEYVVKLLDDVVMSVLDLEVVGEDASLGVVDTYLR